MSRTAKTANKPAEMASPTDKGGSYTGVSDEDPYEIPVQDADDL